MAYIPRAATDARYEQVSRKAVASGYASLDGSTKVPTAQLPAMNYLPLTGGTLTGNLQMSSTQRVTAMADPLSPQDAATLKSVTDRVKYGTDAPPAQVAPAGTIYCQYT